MDVKTQPSKAVMIDGRALARKMRGQVRDAVAALQARGIAPCLAVILAGDDPASQIYVRSKEKMAGIVGIASRVHVLPADAPADALNELIDTLNDDPAVHGILVQLPLPAHLNREAVLSRIDPAKDVDGLHPENTRQLTAGTPVMIPCTPVGCLALIKTVVADVAGKQAVVIGRSPLVGAPMALLLRAAGAQVATIDSKTPAPEKIAQTADILVVAAGCAGLVKPAWVKRGAVVIDVGINRMADGTITGDVDPAVRDVAGYVTPVPGGVGPMTIACLLGNTVIAASRQNLLPAPVFL